MHHATFDLIYTPATCNYNYSTYTARFLITAIGSSMALANTSTGIFDYSWSPQMILDNGPSPEPLSADGGGGWLCGSSSSSLLNFAGRGAEDDDCEEWIDRTYAETLNGRMMISSPEKSKRRQKHPTLVILATSSCSNPVPPLMSILANSLN